MLHHEREDFITMWFTSWVAADSEASWLIPAVATLVVVAAAMVAVRARRRVALRREVASWVGSSAEQVRYLILRDIDEGHWQVMVDSYSQAVRERVLRHHAAVDARIDQMVDGDFFIAAVKGSLADLPAIGQEGWKSSFEVMASERFAAMLQMQTLEDQLHGVLHHAGTQLSTRWVPPAGSVPEAARDVSPERLRGLLGLPEGLGDSFIRESIFDAAALSATIIGALSMGTGASAVGGLLAVMDNGLFQEFVAELVLDYIVEEVGEEVLEEVAESLVAFFTGIGALYTLYKFGKYGWKFKKLFIDKEPLVKLRAQLRALVRHRFEEMADALSAQMVTTLTAQRDLLLDEATQLEVRCGQFAPKMARVSTR